MEENAIIAFYAELACLQPGQRIDRNLCFTRLGIGRQRGCREVAEIFKDAPTDPLALYVLSLGVRQVIDSTGRAYLERAA
jgi:hypothetical protein